MPLRCHDLIGLVYRILMPQGISENINTISQTSVAINSWMWSERVSPTSITIMAGLLWTY